jgi:hypothetical protein
MKTIKINLTQIFWKDGQFVNCKNRPVKVEAVGIPHNFESLANNTIIRKEEINKVGNARSIEKRRIRTHLDCMQDTSYHCLDAYTKSSGVRSSVNSDCFIPVNFYRLIK